MDARFLAEIRKLYESGAAELARSLTFEKLTRAGGRRKVQLLRSIEARLKELGGATKKLYAEEIPAEYIDAANETREDVGWGEVLKPANFVGIDTAAVQTALATAVDDTQFALSAVNRTCRGLVNSRHLSYAQNAGINRLLAEANVTGETVAGLSRALTGYINPEWFGQYADVQAGTFFKLSGRRWKLSDYAHLTAQVRMGTVANMGHLNWALKHGFRFAQLSRHAGACKVCQQYQGKVFSTTGKPERDHTGTIRRPLSEVPGKGGLIHPYCAHTYMPWGRPDSEMAEEHGSPRSILNADRHTNDVIELES